MAHQLPKEILDPYKELLGKRNLLAFSAGVDSSALFFLLLEEGIDFDIAHINYQTRPQSAQEQAHAQSLAKRYKKRCFSTQAPKISPCNFEAQARAFRYRFFETIIAQEGYDTLLTAHQLNDHIEWFLMRLGKGAGVNELVGMRDIEVRSGYSLLRPLLGVTKAQLQTYLDQHGYPYFYDASNKDLRFERNRIRPLVETYLQAYAKGAKRSLRYLQNDSDFIASHFRSIYQEQELIVLYVERAQILPRAADWALKRLGYLLSANERSLIKPGVSIVAGRKWAIEEKNGYVFIAPYVKNHVLPKAFKEMCRKKGIPPKIRGYLYNTLHSEGQVMKINFFDLEFLK